MSESKQTKSKQVIGEMLEHDYYGKQVVQYHHGPSPDLYEVDLYGRYIGSFPLGTAKNHKENFKS